MKKEKKLLPGGVPFFQTGFVYLGGVMCPGMSSSYSFSVPIGSGVAYSSFLLRTKNLIGRRSGRVCGRLKMVVDGRDCLFEMDFRDVSFLSGFLNGFSGAGLRVRRHAGLAVLDFGGFSICTSDIACLDLRAEFLNPGYLDVWGKRVLREAL